MERKKLFVRIGIGAAGVLLLVALAFVVRAVGNTTLCVRASKRGSRWGASSGHGASAEDVFKDTVDPNCYLLEDADGNEVGWVHLARRSAACWAASSATRSSALRTYGSIGPARERARAF